MSAARRRRKARERAAFWAEREARARRSGTLTVTLTADADQFRQAFGPFVITDRDIAHQIEQTNRAAMRLVDHHVDQVLANPDVSLFPTQQPADPLGDLLRARDWIAQQTHPPRYLP